MATATMLKRTARAHNQVVAESDEALLGNVSCKSVSYTTPTLYGDAFATAITVGGGTRTAAGTGASVAVTGGDPGVAANAGGAVTVTGGAGNTSGAGGAVTIAGGAGGATDATGGAVSITTGAGGGTNGDSGALTIDVGAPGASGTGGTLTIGGTNASAVTLGSASVPIDFDGGITVAAGKAITGDGALTVTATSAILSLDGTGIETSATTFTGDGALTVAATGTLSLDSSTNVIQTNATSITSDGALTVAATGTLSLDSSTNTIQTNATSITADAALTIAATSAVLSLDGTAIQTSATSITSDTALSISTTGANVLALDTGGSSTINIGNANATDINIGAGGATVDIGTTSSGAVTLNSGSTIAIGDGSAGAVTVDSAAGISLDGGAASNFTTSAGALDINGNGGVNIQGNANEVDITSTGGIDINANGSSAFTIDGTNTSTVNVTSADLNLKTTTSGTVNIDGQTSVAINSAAGTIDIGTDAVASTSITIGNNSASSAVELIAGSGGTVQISGDGVVTGNLDVQGTLTTVETQSLQVTDPYIYMNDGYETASARTGGLSVNYLPTATTDTVAGTGFHAHSGAANPYVDTTGAATFSTGDIIQIHNANNADNDGLFEVLTHSSNVLTVRGLGTTTNVEDFTKNEFVTDTNTSGSIYKVNVSVIRAADGTGSTTAGDWEVGKGSTTGITYNALATSAGVTLQTAYAAGNTITMTDANGDFDVSVSSGTPAISLDAAGASNFTVASNSLTLSTTTSGVLDIDAAGILSLNSSAAINIGNDANDQNVFIGTGGTRSIFIGSNTSSTSVTIDTGSGGLTIDADGASGWAIAGALTLTTSGSSSWANDTGNLAISTTTSGLIDIDSVGSVSVNSSGGQVFIGNDAVAQKITVGGETSTRTEVELNAILLDLNAGTGGFTIDGGGASNVTTSSGALTITSAAAATWSVTSGDLNLTATASSAIITGAEAASDAVQLTASNAAGGIQTSAGTGGYGIGDADTAVQTNDLFTGGTGAKTNTIGSTASTSSLLLQAGSGSMVFTAGGIFDVNAQGAVTIDSNTAGVSIDAVGASNFGVNGADLTLSSTSHTVIINAGEAAADAIDLNASAGGVTVDCVTGFSLDASNAGSSNITLVNTTAATPTTLTITANNTGATSGNATIDINATSTNGQGIIELDADDTISAEVLTGGTINIGADAVALTVNIGTGGTGASTVNIGDESVAGSTVLIESGSTGDITFDARGISTPLTVNDASDINLDGGFTSNSIVGCLNELIGGSGAASEVVVTGDTSASTIYYCVGISGTDQFGSVQADADANANFVGVVKVDGASGEVITDGETSIAFDAGLSPAAGNPVYLSATNAGYATTTAPSTTGQVVYQIGYVKNIDSYSGTGGQTMTVVLRFGGRVVL